VKDVWLNGAPINAIIDGDKVSWSKENREHQIDYRLLSLTAT